MPVDPKIYATSTSDLNQSFIDTLNADLSEQIGKTRFRGPDGCALTLISTAERYTAPDGLAECNSVIEAHLVSPYYGPRYARGSWPEIAAVLEFLRRRIPKVQVWYGTDMDDQVEEVVDDWMSKMWDYWSIHGSRPYYSRKQRPEG